MLPRVSKIECNDEHYLVFSNSDVIANTLFRFGSWEQHLIDLSMFFLQGLEAPLVLDIGANLGAYSIPIARQIRNVGGKVIGFEPQRVTFYQLCGNIVLNRLDNVFAYNKAVGDQDGMIDLPEVDYERNDNAGAFSIDQKYRVINGVEGSMKAETSAVPIMTLDGLELETAPALIKIDVEGYELNVLRGGADFLQRHDYPPILFEAWSFDWFKEAREELIGFVSSLGYQITLINHSDYVAQHPRNAVQVAFIPREDGSVTLARTRSPANHPAEPLPIAS